MQHLCTYIWTPENIDQLKGCFECTDWGVMKDSSTNIDQATGVITSFIRFCEDNIVLKKSIKRKSKKEEERLYSQVA